MTGQGVVTVLFALVVASVVSVAGKLMPSHADAVFLGVVTWSWAMLKIRGKVISHIDMTNGNDIGVIAFFLYVFVALVCAVAAPAVTLFGVLSPVTALVIASVVVGIAAAWTAWMHA